MGYKHSGRSSDDIFLSLLPLVVGASDLEISFLFFLFFKILCPIDQQPYLCDCILYLLYISIIISYKVTINAAVGTPRHALL